MYAYSFDNDSEYTGPFTTKTEALMAASLQRKTYSGKVHLVELAPISLMDFSTLRKEIDSLRRSLNWALEYTFTLEGRASDTLIDDSDYFFDMLEGWMEDQKVLQPPASNRQTVTLNWLMRLKLMAGKEVV